MNLYLIIGMLVCGLALPAIVDAQMVLTSPAFEDNGGMSLKYAHSMVSGGENVSLPLQWAGAPPNTESFVLLMYDRHQLAGNWIHWLVIDIPPNVNELVEGASLTGMMPNRSIELRNSFGANGYGGPAPPSGSGTHEYAFVLYAINDDNTNLEPNINYTYNQILQQLNEDTITTAEISGLFNRDTMPVQNTLWQLLKQTIIE